MSNKIIGKITGNITGKTPNKITNKIIGKITGNITGKMNSKNFTGSGAGLFKGRFAGSFKAVFFVGLLFSLVGVANSLQAQEGEQAGKQAGQQGWFVGVSPFVMDVKLKKTSRRVGEERTEVSKLVTEVVSPVVAAISYDATVPNFDLNAVHRVRFGSSTSGSRQASANSASLEAELLCENGTIREITQRDDLGDIHGQPSFAANPDTIYLVSYDETTVLTVGLSQILQNTPATTTDISASDCKDFFESALSSSAPMTTLLPGKPPEKLPDKTSEETSKLKGTGISFGFNFEKYSLSFNQLQWSAGDDKLQAQVLLARYFLPYGLSVGGGLASAKLGTSFGSASGTAPALHFAYNYPVTKNLQIQVSLFWLGLDLAVQDTQIINSTPTTTTTASTLTTAAPTFQRRAVVGLQRRGGHDDNDYEAEKSDRFGVGNEYDTRVVVTATIPSEVRTTTTTSTTKTVSGGRRHRAAEIKNPATISINFIWRFR